jgi:hypothetical protein
MQKRTVSVGTVLLVLALAAAMLAVAIRGSW